uniref:Extended FMRFamide-10 n=1 Tax=Mantophasma kudubergense TaxID=1037657 RepID=FAR10_MANKU|nr:RecName: Full=Extended FMRFamide-10; Short=FMRFa-10 [Mantophasma kudubergense]
PAASESGFRRDP